MHINNEKSLFFFYWVADERASPSQDVRLHASSGKQLEGGCLESERGFNGHGERPPRWARGLKRLDLKPFGPAAEKCEKGLQFGRRGFLESHANCSRIKTFRAQCTIFLICSTPIKLNMDEKKTFDLQQRESEQEGGFECVLKGCMRD